jgi:hypothetical protein
MELLEVAEIACLPGTVTHVNGHRTGRDLSRYLGWSLNGNTIPANFERATYSTRTTAGSYGWTYQTSALTLRWCRNASRTPRTNVFIDTPPFHLGRIEPQPESRRHEKSRHQRSFAGADNGEAQVLGKNMESYFGECLNQGCAGAGEGTAAERHERIMRRRA